jgi:hypothetical protein
MNQTRIALCHYLFIPRVYLYLGLKGLQLLSNPCHAAPDLRQQVFLLKHPDGRFELGDSVERRLVHRFIPIITRFEFSSCQGYELAACFRWTKAGFVRISGSKRKFYLIMKKFQKWCQSLALTSDLCPLTSDHRSIPMAMAPGMSSHPQRRQKARPQTLSSATMIIALWMPALRRPFRHSSTSRLPNPSRW